MNVTRNAVYSYVYDKIIADYPAAYISGRYEPVPETFPAVFLREIGDVNNEDNVTFSGSQSVRTSTFEAQVVSDDVNGSLSQAYSILETVSSAFEELFYVKTNVTLVEEGQYGKYRIRASYQRVIGDADEMPTT